MLQKIIMWVLAVAFLFVGVGFVVDPVTFTDMATGVEPDGASSLTEIRAVSGGVALGLGLFFALCTRMTAWVPAGLVLGRVAELTGRLEEWEVVLRDLGQGLVDFPAVVDGAEAYLCWRLGEPTVAWWHPRDTGIAGRRPL